MIDQAVHEADERNVEIVMREELARGDAVAESVLPVLRHLVSGEDSSIFNDEILARIRGMLADLATSMLGELLAGAGGRVSAERRAREIEVLTRAFLDNAALLSHVHALAFEWQLTERLQHRLALDPVVSPLLQALMSSEDGATQGMAMRFLAAQARWTQSQRRMKLPLLELPAELFHTALMTLRTHLADDPGAVELGEQAEIECRTLYNEGSTRLGLASLLVMSLGADAPAALSVSHAGVALFLAALALRSGQGRDAAVLSTHETQVARLSLALRAAGLDPKAVEQQFLTLHPEVTLPPGFEGLSADDAVAILSHGRYLA